MSRSWDDTRGSDFFEKPDFDDESAVAVKDGCSAPLSYDCPLSVHRAAAAARSPTMRPLRAKRSANDAMPEDDEEEEEEEEVNDNSTRLEADAAVAKVPKQPSRKRRKEGRGLNLDALGLVMAYVGYRELYGFAFSCKTLHDNLTMGMVVKSAMITGNRTCNKVLAGVTKDLGDRAIYMPSPIRLLRLFNAKRCEFCCRKVIPSLGPTYYAGFFACWPCHDERMTDDWELTGVLKLIERRPRMMESHSILMMQTRLRCIEQIRSDGCRGIRFHTGRQVAGETCGAILSTALWQTIAARLKLPNADMTSVIDQVLDYDPASKPGYKQFMRSIQSAKKLAKEAEVIRRDERQQTALRAAKNKFKHLVAVLGDLESKLSDQIRPFILKRHVDAKYSVTFDCPVVHDMLKHHVRTPKKVTSKELDEAAATLNNRFSLLLGSNLLSVNFLSNKDPFERRIKSMFQDQFPDLVSMAPKLTENVFTLIGRGELYNAMCSLADFSFDRAAFGSKLLCGLMAPRLPSSRASRSRVAGAHWLTYHKQNRNAPGRAYTQAIRTLDGMMNMTEAFLSWAETKGGSNAPLIAYCNKALYTVHNFRMIDSGNFEKLWDDLQRGFLRDRQRSRPAQLNIADRGSSGDEVENADEESADAGDDDDDNNE